MKNFTSAITYSSPDGLTPDFLPPSPVFKDGRSYADVITNFSPMDRLRNFLSYGAPLAGASHLFYTVSFPKADSKSLENFVKAKRNKLKAETFVFLLFVCQKLYKSSKI